MGKVISVLNLKGGVGKTSTCHHLGGTLAAMGKRVLLIDNDPQASLTQGFYGPVATRQVGLREGVAALYDPDNLPVPEAIVRPSGFEGASLVAGSAALAEFNMTPVAEWGEAERGIREFVDEVRDDYDVVLIDNPPNLYLCARASLVASDFILVPLQAEDYGAQGIDPVLDAVRRVAGGPNPSLRLLGFLLTIFDKRMGIHQTYASLLKDRYSGLVFEAPFPATKDFKEAVSDRKPISHYKPKSAAAKAMRAIAEEFLARVEGVFVAGSGEGVAA